MHSDWVIAEAMRQNAKQSTRMINYNGISNSNSDNDKEFVDINLVCNKLNVRLLANDYIIRIMKRLIFETED